MRRAAGINRMWDLVIRDHGGCEEEGCSLARFIEDGECFDAIHAWACSGAACEEFNKLYDKHEKFLRKQVGAA